jgi:prepilin-type N-terminal cleavage/methylation domain-containing protein
MAHFTLMKTSPRACAGFTLHEVLVGLAVAGLAMIAIAKTVALLNRSGAMMLSSASGALAQQKTSAAIRRALDDVNRSRIPLNPIIMDGADISARRHPLASLKGTSAPRPSSDVISIVEVSPLHRGSITETLWSGNKFSITACGFAQIPDSAAFRSFIAAGTDEVFQLVGRIQQVSDSCGVFEGAAIAGLVSYSTPSPQGFISLWGVLREYSLFIDRSSQFRIASHVGMHVLENQPITRGVRSISLSATTSDTARFFKLTVSAPGAQALTTLTPSLFTERPAWEELWG